MYERFSDEARRAMQVASQVAMRSGHQFIAPEDLLLGVLAQPGLVELCESLGVAPEAIKRNVEDAQATTPSSPTPVAKEIIENAIEESRVFRHRGVDTYHVMLGILRLTDTAAAQALNNAGLTIDRLREELARLFPPESDLPESPQLDTGQQYRNHPEVQALQRQVDGFQRQQEAALARQDFRAAAEFRDKKVEARFQLKALLDRLREQ